jgi:hypothetical protein
MAIERYIADAVRDHRWAQSNAGGTGSNGYQSQNGNHYLQCAPFIKLDHGIS